MVNKITKKPKPRLVEPNIKYKHSYLEALKEYQKIDKGAINIKEIENNFSAFLKKIKNDKTSLSSDRVPQIKYWCLLGNKYIGHINFRPILNEQLQFKSGNIAYSVRPLERRKGYASFMLNKILKKAAKAGMSSVMLSCDNTNIASKSVIKKAGGLYQGQGQQNKIKFKRYTIDLTEKNKTLNEVLFFIQKKTSLNG